MFFLRVVLPARNIILYIILYRWKPCSSFARRNVSEIRAADSIYYIMWRRLNAAVLHFCTSCCICLLLYTEETYGEQKLEDLKERPPFVWRPGPSKAFVYVYTIYIIYYYVSHRTYTYENVSNRSMNREFLRKPER